MLLFSFYGKTRLINFSGLSSTLYNFSYDVAFGHAVFAYLYQDGFMIASLSDGWHVIPELAVKGDGEERMKDGGYYTDVVCGKKCFYILSQGDVETSGLSGASSIEVYDYEGNPKMKEWANVEFAISTLSHFNYPVYMDTLGIFERLNPHLPHSPMFHTFLLDENNNVLLVGNPLGNEKIEGMFWQIVKEKLGKCE